MTVSLSNGCRTVSNPYLDALVCLERMVKAWPLGLDNKPMLVELDVKRSVADSHSISLWPDEA